MYTLPDLLHFAAYVLIVAVTVPAVLYLVIPAAQRLTRRPHYSRKGH